MRHRSVVNRLISEQAVIYPVSNTDTFMAYSKGDRRRRPVCWLSSEQFSDIRADGVLRGSGAGFRICKTAIRRLQSSQFGQPHSAQHRVLETQEKFVYGDSLRSVQVNTRLTPLRRLAKSERNGRKQVLSMAEIEAGERFSKDYEFSGMQNVATQNYERVSGGQAGNSGSTLSENRIDARNRVWGAIKAMGPGLIRWLHLFACMN